MRVCFVSCMFSPSVGGTQARAEKQARQLLSLGHAVTVVTLHLNKKWKRVETLNGLPVVRVGGIYRRNGRLRLGRVGYLPIALAMLPALWRLRFQYDLIHVFDVTPFTLVAALIGKMAKKPVVISIQNTGPDDEQRKQLKQRAMLMADTLPNADFLKISAKDWLTQAGDFASLPLLFLGGRIISYCLLRSPAIFQCLSVRSHVNLLAHGVRPERIVLISGSVNTEKFQPSIHQSGMMRSELDVICVARLEYSKGIDVLLHAWARIMRVHDEVSMHQKPRLRLVGEGALRAQLEQLANELGVQDSVEFLGSQNDVVDLLQQSRIFVLPSRWEGMPNALLEAMACGLPCVATRVSGSEDVIEQGVNGLLVEGAQPVEMANALVRLMEDRDFAELLGRKARETVVRQYQLSNIVERCLQLYRSLLKDQDETTATSLPYSFSILEGGSRDE